LIYKCAVFKAGARGLGPMAYLGYPTHGDKLSLGAPTQSVHGSIDAKNELGIKGRRKMTGAKRVVVFRPV